jgi:hypothetical protein
MSSIGAVARSPQFLTRPKGPEKPMGVHTKRKTASLATNGPSLREETPKAGSDSGSAIAHPIETIAIGGSIEGREASDI